MASESARKAAEIAKLCKRYEDENAFRFDDLLSAVWDAAACQTVAPPRRVIPKTLMDGAITVAPVEGLRNKVGEFMWERGINMGDKLDAGRVQDLIEEWATTKPQTHPTPAKALMESAIRGAELDKKTNQEIAELLRDELWAHISILEWQSDLLEQAIERLGAAPAVSTSAEHADLGDEVHDHICVYCRKSISLCDGKNCWGRFFVCLSCQSKAGGAVSTPRCPRCHASWINRPDDFREWIHDGVYQIYCAACGETYSLLHVAEFLQFFQPAPSPPQWISVKERLPEISGEYIAHFVSGTVSGNVHWNASKKQWGTNKDGTSWNVTHWQLLPDPSMEMRR